MVLYIFLEVYTLILLLLVIWENYITKKRNENKILLKDINPKFNYVFYLKIIASIIHPNMLFFRLKLIDE